MFYLDQSQCFFFDDIDVCGEMVDFECSYSEVLVKYFYLELVVQLFGEMFVVVLLFCGMFKFDGLLVLQVCFSGVVLLLMVECFSDCQVCGLVCYLVEFIGVDVGMQELMFEGVLIFIVDLVKGQCYQGIVVLEGVNLVECLFNYFVSLEQLLICFWFNVNGCCVCGLLLQQFFVDCLKDFEVCEVSWQYLIILVDMLIVEELLVLDNEIVLYCFYYEEIVCLFEL